MTPMNDDSWRDRILTSSGIAGLIGRMLVLAGILCAFGAGLALEPQLARALAVAIFGAAAVFFRPMARPKAVLSAFAVVALGTYAVRKSIDVEGAVVVAMTSVCALGVATTSRYRPTIFDVVALSVFSAIALAASQFDWIWFTINDLGNSVTRVAALVGDPPKRWSSSYSAIWPTILGLIYVVGGAIVSERSRRATIATAIAVLILTPPAYLLAAAAWMRGTGYSNGSLGSTVAFFLQWSVIPWIALVVHLSAARVDGLAIDLWPRVRRSGAIAAASAAVVLVLSTGAAAPPETEVSGKGRVLFVDRSGPLADYSVPTWDRLGYGQSGIYGQFIKLLASTGRESTISKDTVDDALIAKYKTVVITVPTQAFTESEMDVLHRFVDRGGGLLLLLDHTDLFGLAGPSNALLERYGIEVRFDTVMESARSLLGNVEIRRVGALPAHQSPINTQILHGASLRLSGDARPWIVGRAMFGDFGNRLNGGNGGYLGDYIFRPEEEAAGDLVLAAVADSGEGRVVVFGDTSSFQNVALARSASFVNDVFATLERRSIPRDRVVPWAAIVLAAATLLAARISTLRSVVPAAAVVGHIVLGAFFAVDESRADNSRILAELPPRSAFVLHTGCVPLFDRDQFKPRSVQGLLTTAARVDLVGLTADIEEIRDFSSVAVVCLGPSARSPDRDTVDRLERFVRDGGIVLAAAGYEERRGVEDFLARFGMRIVDIPLSAAPMMTLEQQRNYKGPIFAEAWPIAAPTDQATEKIHEVDGFPIVVKRRAGSGCVIAVGDSWFLNDKNFEGESKSNPMNVALMRTALFDSLAKAKEERR